MNTLQCLPCYLYIFDPYRNSIFSSYDLLPGCFHKRRMLTQNMPTAVRIVVLLSLIAIPVYSLMVPFLNKLPAVDSSTNIRRQNGNPNVAGDLYGIGIRTGAYLQILGMLLSCVRTSKRSRIGIKLLSSAICLTILLTWTILVSRRTISPCEAWLILSLANAYATPREAAIKDWECEKERGGVAMTFALLSVVWQSVSFMWFFTTLISQLPLLRTNNRVWFFASVNISGWFRILMLLYSSFCCLMLPLEVIEYLRLLQTTFDEWAALKRRLKMRSDHVRGVGSYGTSQECLENSKTMRCSTSFITGIFVSGKGWSG